MHPPSDPVQQDETLIAKRFREALVTPYGPADLSTALRAIAPLLLDARELGVSWLHLSETLSKVRLEIQHKPLSDATLRGVLCKTESPRMQVRLPARPIAVPVPAAGAAAPGPERALPAHPGIPPPAATLADPTLRPEDVDRRARLRARRQRLKALSD